MKPKSIKQEQVEITAEQYQIAADLSRNRYAYEKKLERDAITKAINASFKTHLGMLIQEELEGYYLTEKGVKLTKSYPEPTDLLNFVLYSLTMPTKLDKL